MIRDPSDGSVRDIPPTTLGQLGPVESAVLKASDLPPLPSPGPDTGVRQPARTDAQLRLEKSRQWLRDYHARKSNPQKPDERHVSAFED